MQGLLSIAKHMCDESGQLPRLSMCSSLTTGTSQRMIDNDDDKGSLRAKSEFFPKTVVKSIFYVRLIITIICSYTLPFCIHKCQKQFSNAMQHFNHNNNSCTK